MHITLLHHNSLGWLRYFFVGFNLAACRIHFFVLPWTFNIRWPLLS